MDNKQTMTGDTHLHCVVQQLVLELLDVEDLLEEVVELLLVHELVPQHGGGQPLARPPRLLVLGYCVVLRHPAGHHRVLAQPVYLGQRLDFLIKQQVNLSF